MLGGGREVGMRGTAHGRRGEKMRQFPRLGKTVQWEAEVTGTETFQKEDERERKGDK